MPRVTNARGAKIAINSVFGKLASRARMLSSYRLVTGFPDTLMHQGTTPGAPPTSVSDDAYKNEFGDGKVPARPVLVPTFHQKSQTWEDAARKGIAIVLLSPEDRPPTHAIRVLWSTVGAMVVRDVVEGYHAIISPPLSDTTVRLREQTYNTGGRVGRDEDTLRKPLIWTGNTVSGFTYVVEKK